MDFGLLTRYLCQLPEQNDSEDASGNYSYKIPCAGQDSLLRQTCWSTFTNFHHFSGIIAVAGDQGDSRRGKLAPQLRGPSEDCERTPSVSINILVLLGNIFGERSGGVEICASMDTIA